MQITSNYNLTRLFINKTIDVFIDNKKSFQIKLKTIQDFYNDDSWNAIYHFWTADPKALADKLGISSENVSAFDIIEAILNLGSYDRFRPIYNMMVDALKDIIPNIEVKNTTLKINDVTINAEIWEYIVYLLNYLVEKK